MLEAAGAKGLCLLGERSLICESLTRPWRLSSSKRLARPTLGVEEPLDGLEATGAHGPADVASGASASAWGAGSFAASAEMEAFRPLSADSTSVHTVTGGGGPAPVGSKAGWPAAGVVVEGSAESSAATGSSVELQESAGSSIGAARGSTAEVVELLFRASTSAEAVELLGLAVLGLVTSGCMANPSSPTTSAAVTGTKPRRSVELDLRLGTSLVDIAEAFELLDFLSPTSGATCAVM